MMVRNTLRGAALASTCLLPLAAFAQTADLNNEVSVGVQYQSSKSAMYGRYNGDWDQGFRSTTDFHLKGGDAWDSGKTYGYDAYGKGLDVSSGAIAPEGTVGFKVGQQGKWGAGFNYDAITYFQSDSFKTVYASGSAGALNNGVVPGGYKSWQANTVPLLTEDVKTRRDRFTGTGKYDLGSGFEVSATLFHEHKEGTMEQSMSMGSTTSSLYPPNATRTAPSSPLTGAPAASTAAGALGALVYFPQPIDYDTDRYDAKVKYKGSNLQSELGYSFSKFTNQNLTFTGVDPFSLAGPGATAAQTAPGGLYALPGQAAFALPPDNYQHAVTADAGYSLTPTTQLSGTFQYALQIADNQLSPSGQLLNPNLTPTAAQAQLLNNPIGGTTNNWNPTAKIMNGNVTLTSRPFNHFDVKAAYNINTYENDQSRTAMLQAGSVTENTAIPATTAAQLAATNCAGASVDACTIPWAWTKQKVSLDAGYSFLPGTRFSLGYALQDVDRKYMMNDHSIENSVTAKFNTRLSNKLFGTVSLEHSDRIAPSQNLGSPNAPLEFSSYYLNNGGAAWFDTSRVADSVNAKVLYAVSDKLNFGLNGQWVVDRYTAVNAEGMNWDTRASVGPQVTYRPIPSVNASLFYNYQQNRYNSHSVFGTICTNATGTTTITQATAAAPNPTCAAGTTGQSGAGWNQTNNDGTHTLGADVEWQAIPDVLKIVASYNLSYGDISWDYADNLSGSTLGAMNAYNAFAWTWQPIPNATTIMNSFKLHGEYSFTPAMSLWMGYTFERLTNSDYNNAVQQASYASALLSGDSNPNYNVHIVSAALRVKF